jgi:hypothetical protein
MRAFATRGEEKQWISSDCIDHAQKPGRTHVVLPRALAYFVLLTGRTGARLVAETLIAIIQAEVLS